MAFSCSSSTLFLLFDVFCPIDPPRLARPVRSTPVSGNCPIQRPDKRLDIPIQLLLYPILSANSRLNHYAHIVRPLFLLPGSGHAHRCSQAAITLLYYDWLVTLPAEIAHVWRRPLGASSGWFLLNRYLSVLGNVAVSVVQLAPLPKAACGSAVLFHQILLIGAQVVVCSAYIPF